MNHAAAGGARAISIGPAAAVVQLLASCRARFKALRGEAASGGKRSVRVGQGYTAPAAVQLREGTGQSLCCQLLVAAVE